MAWNPPSAFAADEVVTAAKLNQLRESLAYLKGGAGEVEIDNHLQLAGAFELRFGTGTDATISRASTGVLVSNAALRLLGGGIYINGGTISRNEVEVSLQAGARRIFTAAENITLTQELTTISSGIVGRAFAVGSSTGWTAGGGDGTFAASSGTLLSFATGAFVLEINSGVVRARRVSGSETWAIVLDAIVR